MALRRCKYLGVDGDKRLSRHKAYRCSAPDPDMPIFPASVAMFHAFSWPPPRGYVVVDYHCEKCALYEKAK